MTEGALERVLSRGTVGVVLATHVLGIPCDAESLAHVARKHGALLVEDAAPALGARWRGRLVGTFGDAAIVSFQSTKVISGEAGGALLTSDDGLAGRIQGVLGIPVAAGGAPLATAAARTLATRTWAYGATHLAYRLLAGERMFEVVRPSEEMPARYLARCPRSASALVLRQLDRLEWNVGRRRAIASAYQEALAGVPGVAPVVVPSPAAPAWIQYPVRASDKAAFYAHMRRHGVDVTWTYRYSCADSYGVECPEAREAAMSMLGLPTYPSLTDADVRRVCRAMRAYGGGGAGRGGAPGARASGERPRPERRTDGRRAYLLAKRVMDVTSAALGLIVLSPALAVLAALVKLSSRGPVLFRQPRVGSRGRPFTILKFRTMRHAASGPAVTSRGDERITPVGRFLRRYKLDELPQLWNVLVGDMSLVGPRPEVPRYVERFSKEYARILTVRPGITDFAALEFRDEESLLDRSANPEAAYVDVVLPAKIALYQRYLDEMCLATDVRLVCRTLRALVR
jgi:lipopolysaccharide/colanic/teichoic acid biosynthesis glycosyltransferase/dTDP-4-amino-4,6-dideoxygalactose transaminase